MADGTESEGRTGAEFAAHEAPATPVQLTARTGESPNAR